MVGFPESHYRLKMSGFECESTVLVSKGISVVQILLRNLDFLQFKNFFWGGGVDSVTTFKPQAIYMQRK